MSDTLLHQLCSCETPDVEEVLRLFITVENASCEDSVGRLPLHNAAFYCRSIEVVQHLVNLNPKAAMVKDRDLHHLPAHRAAHNGSLEIFKLIDNINPAAIVDTCDYFGTPLHHGILNAKHSIEIVKYICEKYPHAASVPNNDDFLPLHWYCMMTTDVKLEVFETLYQAYPKAIEMPGGRDKLVVPLHCLLDRDDLQDASMSDESMLVFCFCLRQYPEALSIADGGGRTAYSLCSNMPDDVKRIILRTKPDIDLEEYRRLNYENRRLVMLTVSAAKYSNREKQEILYVLWTRVPDIFREVVSYL